jgi:hypothetical protein
MAIIFFSLEELEELDEHQLSLLRQAIAKELRTNGDIHKIVHDKFAPVRTRMAAQRRARGPGPAQGT